MSIPSAVAAGAGLKAALGVAKLTAGAAVELAEFSAESASNFAEFFATNEQASTSDASFQDADARSTDDSLRDVIDQLMDHLGLSSDSPIELRLDDHGKIQVTTPHPAHSSPADAAARMQLQSAINGSEELQSKLASYLV